MALQYKKIGLGHGAQHWGGPGNGAGRLIGPPATQFGWVGQAGQQGMGGYVQIGGKSTIM